LALLTSLAVKGKMSFMNTVEVSPVTFAHVALRVAQAVLPAYRSRFSKHTFTQPQLLAVLCLMRYEDWTFREAEARLREHGDLRAALGLGHAPDYSTLHRFLRRLPAEVIDRGLAEAVARLPRRPGRPRRQARIAVDSTGLTPGAVSTFFIKRAKDRVGADWRHWPKWTVAFDLDKRVILAQAVRQGPCNDCATLRPLVSAAQRLKPVGLVLADAEFDSERNHRHVRDTLGARSVIPAKRGKAAWRLRGTRAQMRRHFPHRTYARRALIESGFSAVKRKLSSRAPGRSLEMQRRQAHLLGLAFNLYQL
jgi:hypothetical protein